MVRGGHSGVIRGSWWSITVGTVLLGRPGVVGRPVDRRGGILCSIRDVYSIRLRDSVVLKVSTLRVCLLSLSTSLTFYRCRSTVGGGPRVRKTILTLSTTGD